MKRAELLTLSLFFMLMTLSGCELVGDIFEAGLWVGMIIVVLVVAAVIWIFRKFTR